MIIVSSATAKAAPAGNKVKMRSSQAWPGLAYEPGANKPITVAHMAGDIFVLFVSDYNWASWGTPTVGGPGAPVWNYLEGLTGAGGVFWARATSSSHTIGVIDPGGGNYGTWYATVGVFGNSAAENPIGGFRYGRTTGVQDAEIPAITLADSSGNSAIFAALHGYGFHPTETGNPDYTPLEPNTAWTAPNTSLHTVGSYVKGDTTSDGATILSHTDNGAWTYVNSCHVEIIGGVGTPTSTVDSDTIQTGDTYAPVWVPPPPVQQSPPVVVEPPPDVTQPTPTPITITSVTTASGGTPLWADPIWYINGSNMGLVNDVRSGFNTSNVIASASILSVTATQVIVQHNLPLTATSTGAALYVNGSDGGGSGWFTFPVTPAPVVVEPGPTGPVDTGVTPPVTRPTHAPETTEFGLGMGQLYTFPDWADAVDIICVGGGGGGQGGGAANSYGAAGSFGTWAGRTLLKTANIPRLYVTVGHGGDAGRGPLKDVGTDGQATVVTDGVVTTLCTGAGGAHGASGMLGGAADSLPLPPYTFNGVTYPGTPGSVAHDPPPAPAGHGVGGAGGVGKVIGGENGGVGGPGKVWIRAYQLT